MSWCMAVSKLMFVYCCITVVINVDTGQLIVVFGFYVESLCPGFRGYPYFTLDCLAFLF
jgi:hypothetical protein